MMKYSKLLFAALLVVLLGTTLSACGGANLGDAGEFGEEFIATLGAGDYETGYAMFSPGFAAWMGLTAEQMEVVLPPATFGSYTYTTSWVKIEAFGDEEGYTVARMDGTLTTQVGTPIYLIMDVIHDSENGYAIDSWIFDMSVVDREEVARMSQLAMLSIYLGDFDALELIVSDTVSIEGAAQAFPYGSIENFEVLNVQSVVSVTADYGLLPVQLVQSSLTDGDSTRLALFWRLVDNTWKLHGMYACPPGGFGGFCEMDPPLDELP